MATYTITRTITYEETFTVADVDSEQEAVEVIESGQLDPDVAVPVGDERYDVDSIHREDDEDEGAETVSYDDLRDGLRERGISDVEITPAPSTDYDWDVRRESGERVALGGEVHGWTWTYYDAGVADSDVTDGIEDQGNYALARMLDAVAFLLRNGQDRESYTDDQDRERYSTDPAPALVWETAGTCEPRDQTASSDLASHSWWSLGPNGNETWSVELIVALIPTEGVLLGRFDTEDAAKAAAEAYERANRTENPR